MVIVASKLPAVAGQARLRTWVVFSIALFPLFKSRHFFIGFEEFVQFGQDAPLRDLPYPIFRPPLPLY